MQKVFRTFKKQAPGLGHWIVFLGKKYWLLINVTHFQPDHSSGGYNMQEWTSFTLDPEVLFKGAQTQYFELFWPRTILPLKWRKPETGTAELGVGVGGLGDFSFPYCKQKYIKE